MISCKSDDVSINFSYPRILAAKTSQKDNILLGKAMKPGDREDFKKAMEK